MSENTSEILFSMVAEQLSVDLEKVTLDAKFVDDLQADSLDVVELVMNVEERFGIQIDDNVAGEMETIKDVIDYIDKTIE